MLAGLGGVALDLLDVLHDEVLGVAAMRRLHVHDGEYGVPEERERACYAAEPGVCDENAALRQIGGSGDRRGEGERSRGALALTERHQAPLCAFEAHTAT